MIFLHKTGGYRLVETRNNTKILYLDDTAYAWIEPTGIGEILVATHNPLKSDCVLSVGAYRMYTVEDEPHVSDHEHMELEVGKGEWQGYLLLTGLPDEAKKRSRIIPTKETITGDTRLKITKE